MHDSSWQDHELPLASSVLMLLLEGAQSLTIQSGPEADVAVEQLILYSVLFMPS